MSRNTRPRMKQEPMSEHHDLTSTVNLAMHHGTPDRLSRPLTISSRATSLQNFHTASSGDTTVADGDVEMNGACNMNGRPNQFHSSAYTDAA